MNSKITLRLKITHGGTHEDSLTMTELLKLNDSLKNGGQAILNSHYYQVSGSYLKLFKNKEFSGPYYDFDLKSTKKIVNDLLSV